MNYIFFNNVPEDLRNTKNSQVTGTAIRDLLKSEFLSPSNARALRSLLYQIFQQIDGLGGPRIGRRIPRYEPELLNRPASKVEEFIQELGRNDFKSLFELLETDGSDWAQSYCIRLGLQFYAPFSRVLAAKWSYIIEDRWYPFGPDERKYWESSSNLIDSNLCDIFEKIYHLGQFRVPGSPYWFPSSLSRDGHIKNVDRVWKSSLREFGWPIAPIKMYGSRYRSMTRLDWRYLYRIEVEERERIRANIMAKLSKF